MKSFQSVLLALTLACMILNSPTYAQFPTSPQTPTTTPPLIPASPQIPTTTPQIPASPQIPTTTPQIPITIPQISASPCTSSMLTTFTPCINYITNSTGTGSSPTQGCCNSLRTLMSNGTGCLCQIVTGGVPFKIPINRSLAISLPKACNQPGVPVQCQAAAGAPLPAPGPSAALSPSGSPTAAIAPGPSAATVPEAETPALAPISDTTPSSTTIGSTPAGTSATTGKSSPVTPSAAMPSLSATPSLLFCMVVMLVKYF